MVENFEFSRQQSNEIESGYLFAEAMREARKPGESKSEAMQAVDQLDGSDKRTFNAVADSMRNIMDRLASLPEDVRKEFVSSLAVLDGPAYDLVRAKAS